MHKKNHLTSKLHIKKGDNVKVLSGNHRNKQGKVLQVFPKNYQAIVAGVAIVHKHNKPTSKNPKGSIEKKEAPIHLSKLMLIDPATGQATRVGRKQNKNGKLQRYAKKTGQFIKE